MKNLMTSEKSAHFCSWHLNAQVPTSKDIGGNRPADISRSAAAEMDENAAKN